MPLSFPMCATCPTQLIFLGLITLVIFHEAPHYAISSSLLLLPPPQIQVFISSLSSYPLNLCFSLNMRHPVSHSYKTSEIIVLNTLITATSENIPVSFIKDITVISHVFKYFSHDNFIPHFIVIN